MRKFQSEQESTESTRKKEKITDTKDKFDWKEKYYDTYTYKQKETEKNRIQYNGRALITRQRNFHWSMSTNWDVVYRTCAIFIGTRKQREFLCKHKTSMI